MSAAELVKKHFDEARSRLQQTLDELNREIDERIKEAKRKAMETYERL